MGVESAVVDGGVVFVGELECGRGGWGGVSRRFYLSIIYVSWFFWEKRRIVLVYPLCDLWCCYLLNVLYTASKLNPDLDGLIENIRKMRK